MPNLGVNLQVCSVMKPKHRQTEILKYTKSKVTFLKNCKKKDANYSHHNKCIFARLNFYAYIIDTHTFAFRPSTLTSSAL